MIPRTPRRSFLGPVVVDFVGRPSIVAIDPGRGRPASVDGHPAWVTSGRSRPRYFDGRFLAARDLERDQTYFADRQRELTRAAGAGVVHGLGVTAADQTTLVVGAGAALTAAGELVLITADVLVPLADDAATQRLDGQFGLLDAPRELARRRTGVYVLLARPVTYSADPIALYPASIEARRDPEDGDLIDAVALTLTPFHDPAIAVAAGRQRADLARAIFVARADAGAPIEAVPLALVQLERGFVRWVDPWLVRRELGAEHEGLGAYARAPRGLTEAHVQQYQAHLRAIAADRAAAGKPPGFAAVEELAALPPVGAFPLAALDLAHATERFFPPAVPSVLQVIADDELATILDEQLALPPIDLQASDADLAGTPVAVLVPVPRAIAEALPAELRRFSLRPAAIPPARIRGRGPLGLDAIARRFELRPVMDDLGAKLAAAIGAPTSLYYARVRRAAPGAAPGAVAIDRQDG
jgi:hypothetical protein